MSFQIKSDGNKLEDFNPLNEKKVTPLQWTIQTLGISIFEPTPSIKEFTDIVEKSENIIDS